MSTESSAVEKPVVPGAESGEAAVVVNEQKVDAPVTGDSAESSGAEDSGAKGPATALEAVKAALEVKPAANSPPQGDSPVKAGVPVEAAKPTPEAQAAADKALPFHNHPRWKEVTTAAKALEGQVTTLSPKAERWDALDAKFRETGLSAEDVQPLFEGGAQLKRAGVSHAEIGDLMKIGAACKLGDRQVVQQIAGPVFAALGLELVEKLPAEIQAMIDAGSIDEDAGRKMAGLQFQTRTESARRELAEKRVATVDGAEAESRRDAEFLQASASWEARVKRTDVDWDRKEPFIVDAIKASLERRAPTTAREVEQICQAAYDQVTRIMRGSGAQRPAVKPAVGGTSTTVKVAPRTPLEAVRAGLNV